MACGANGAPHSAGRTRLVVLIDAEYASARHARAVFEATGRLGEATVRRIHGDFSNGRLAPWNAAIRTHSIVPCHQSTHARGRNASDIALAVDAMDLMYRESPDGTRPVSSGSDFARLAQRRREGGFAVWGFGERRTPRAFRAACRRFEIVGKARADEVQASQDCHWEAEEMGEADRNGDAAGKDAAKRSDDVRRTRSIRFSDSEWEEIKRTARGRDMPAAEFVRQTILGLARAPETAGPAPVPPSLAPRFERMFRYTWFLATEKRDAMLREGRGEELDRLVAEARALQESLRRSGPD